MCSSDLNPFKVLFGLSGMGVAPAGVDRPNTGHHHLLIDVNEPLDPNEPIPQDKTHLHFGAGQTEALIELPRVALARHDSTLKQAIECNGGWLFKHTGDGILAAFAVAQSAIDAAVAAQRELDLPVRMGICTGQAEARNDDYYGPPLNRAARIMAAGHGGQVLVAEATAAIVGTADLTDLGEHRLRDLSQALRLYQVRAEGLKETFPALKSLATGNLPAQATSFLGREKCGRYRYSQGRSARDPDWRGRGRQDATRPSSSRGGFNELSRRYLARGIGCSARAKRDNSRVGRCAQRGANTRQFD